MHIRDVNSRVVVAVGEAENVSFLASLTASLILYPAETELGDRIKELARENKIPHQPIDDESPGKATIFVGFNLPDKEIIRYMRIFDKAIPYIVNNK